MTYSMKVLPQVRRLGRTVEDAEGLHVFWTGSGIAFDFTGSYLAVRVRSGFLKYEYYLSLVLDGALLLRVPVMSADLAQRKDFSLTIPLLHLEDTGKVHSVRIVNDVQPIDAEPERFLIIVGLETDGEISPSPAYKYMLEFVGDSISSGEGAIGAQTEEEWISAWFSSVQTFPFLTAQRLGAEYRIISQSGWGISRDWAGDKNNVLPRIYDRTAYPGFPEKRYDFSREPAGAVIINLGTNDAQPRADLAAVKEKGLAFLKEVRTKNPGAVIVWCYGMLGSGRCGSTDMKETLEDMIAAYRSESGDERVFYLQLPNTEGEDLGARSHPGLPSHAKAADVLSAFLQKVLP